MQMKGRTDMTKLIVCFRNFAKTPKMCNSHAKINQLCIITRFYKTSYLKQYKKERNKKWL